MLMLRATERGTMTPETQPKNGKVYRFCKKWWFVLPVFLAFAGMVYGFGKKAQTVDSVLVRHEQMLAKQEVLIDKITELAIALDKKQAVQEEFYKLLKPGLWQQAMQRMDSLNGHDTLR